ncbi:MAG: SIS domain-containing protein, partial [Clostridia bacterium]|nr:SIS domain-containing protein [Clostridia bacterium]
MLMDRYHEAVDGLFRKVRETQRENIIKAGEIVADSVASGGCIYLSSICHYMEMDSIYRGGGPIFYKHFSYDLKVESPSRHRDRSDLGYERNSAAAAKYALTQSELRPGDVLFVSSVSGRTLKVVDLAYEAVQLGIKVIAFTSMEYA